MKRILQVGLATVMILPTFATPLVFAVEGTTTTTNTTTSTDSTKTLAQRIADRKAALKTKLTNTEKTRIVAKCVASQGVVGNVKGKLQSTENARIKAYTAVETNLNELSTKLKDKGVDTTELNTNLVALKAKIDTFNTDLAAYKQDVSDLKDVDCKADPEGFKASLEAARTALTTVSKDGLDIRTYLTDTIKPLLKTIRTQLDTTTSTTGGNQ